MAASSLLYVGFGACGVALLAVIFKRRWCRKVYPRDTVILHQVGRGPWAPSLSPFPLKLETFLRMAKIPYQVEHGFQTSSKGKTPWITYNGDEIADSQFCMQYVADKFKVRCDHHLTAVEKAIGRAFQKMTEEDLYWTVALWRWQYCGDWTFLLNAFMGYVPVAGLRFFSGVIKKQAYQQGKGRHSEKEVIDSAKEALNALSVWLGNKEFFMGETPCEVDCALFGMLAQCLWHMPNSPHESIVKVSLPNLSSYCERMKTRFWPDWDSMITHGGTVLRLN